MKDKIIESIIVLSAGLGIPGLIFWAACASAIDGGASGAAIVTIALTTISEKCHLPYKFAIPLLLVIAVLSVFITKELCDTCFIAAKQSLLAKGKTVDQIIDEINDCIISDDLKEYIINAIRL